MKRIVSFVLALGLLIAGMLSADDVRHETLGYPVLNIEDISFIGRYAAGLQMFPNTIFAGFGGGNTPYNYFGTYYKFNDLLGVGVLYERNPTTGVEAFNTPELPVNRTRPFVQVASFVLGSKLSSLYAGLSAQTYFYDGPNTLVNFVQEDTNSSKVLARTNYGGFKTTFNPSIGLKTEMFDLWLGINSRLNLMRWSFESTNQRGTSAYIQPAVFERLELAALAAMGNPKDASFGAEIRLGWEDWGYTFQAKTNKTTLFRTNSYQGGVVDASLALGAKVRPAPQATLFADISTAIVHVVPVHRKGAPATYTVWTFWTIPALSLGAEFEVVKNLYARLSARPAYTLRYQQPAGKKGLGGPFTRETYVNNTFSVTASTGLGWNIGAFKLNWVLDVNFLDTLLRDPMEFVDINGNGPQLASAAQVNFEF